MLFTFMSNATNQIMLISLLKGPDQLLLASKLAPLVKFSMVRPLRVLQIQRVYCVLTLIA
jgi:hypothetical protein